ncbi:MAG: citrate synthase [Leptospiraceae bacterium]|nr:citrate synthase [Leptospiraceae bacterium]MCP5499053.1 citrate synthase [Leptospiraceae bacterium]
MIQKAELRLDDRSYELPIVTGTDKRQGVDISGLYEKTGVITFDPGLFNTGIIKSSVSKRDPETGSLTYRGYEIRDLARNSTFIETSYLLIYGNLPEKKELADFSARLSKHSLIHEDMLNLFDGFPDRAHPLAVMSTMVMSLSSYYTSEYEESMDKGVDHIALLLSKIRTVAAFSYKKMIGQPFTYPVNSFGFCKNFLHMLFSLPTYKYEVPEEYDRILNKLWILYADHEQNVAATTVQIVGSTHANLFASISAGIAALWGSREGGQNIAAVEMIEDIISEGKGVKAYFEKVKKGELKLVSTGLGHSAYKVKSKRAEVAGELFVDFYKGKKLDPVAEVAMEIDSICKNDEYFLQNNLYPNLEFYSGVIFNSMGIPKNLFTVMQVIGKLPGWMAHWRELRILGEVEKKTRPKQIYSGEQGKKYEKR